MKTNLEEIRKSTLWLFDAVPIEEVEDLPESGLCCHPFTNSIFSYDREADKLVNLTTNDGYKWYRNIIVKLIFSKKTCLSTLCVFIGSPWKMTWFKLCCQYMNERDYAKYLKQCWSDEENPNQDGNVPLDLSIEYFRTARKEYLMNSVDLEYYNSLPDNITVYRGVSPGRARMGLSWTDNKDKALWFKKRFETKNKKGQLLMATISKKNVLAYINERNEQELVVDTQGLTKIKVVVP